MSDEREKVLKQSDEPDVEAHKVLKAADAAKAAEEDAEAPDVEAHKLLHKVLK
jgi:hypothetical protein